MQEVLANNGPEVFILALVLLGVTALVVPLVCFTIQWAKVRHAEIEALMYRAELEASLKQEMINRGMSAEEIRKVLEAAPGAGRGFAGLFDFLKRKKQNWDGKCWADLEKKWADLGHKWGDFGRRPSGCGKA